MSIDQAARASLVQQLESDLRKLIDSENSTYDRAFASTAASYLGFDVDAAENRLSGNRNDYGIDFWQITDDACTVLQFKSHDYTHEFREATTYGPDEIQDIGRIQNLLATLSSAPKGTNADVVELVKRLRSRLHA